MLLLKLRSAEHPGLGSTGGGMPLDAGWASVRCRESGEDTGLVTEEQMLELRYPEAVRRESLPGKLFRKHRKRSSQRKTGLQKPL